LNKHKLGSATSQEILNDFERMGIHITDGNMTGEDFNNADYNKVVEVVDMTLDPNVQMMITLRREEERIMEEIVNVPKVAMGQQQGYLGAKTQAGSIAQSNLGTSYLYQGFIQYIERDLQYALNQYKVSLLDMKTDTLGLLDDNGIQFLEITEDFKFEDFGVYIKVKDFLDEQAKERLLAIAQAAMQNQLIDMRDYLRIETAKTYTEILKELEYSMDKKDRERKRAEEQAQIMQAAQMEQQMAMQQQQQAMAQEGNNYRSELKFVGDMAKNGPPPVSQEAPAEATNEAPTAVEGEMAGEPAMVE
jgi:hypothetical protein